MRRIEIVTPAPTGAQGGNRVTAERWARLIGELGYRVEVTEVFSGDDVDALIALHARRSFHAIAGFRVRFPERPLIVGMSGTDLYVDIHRDPEAQRALALADRLVVLQARGLDELDDTTREKARVIHQSTRGGVARDGLVSPDRFNVCVVAHLRDVKDPFCAAEAAALLPASSKLHVIGIGRALSRDMEKRARTETASNPRYEWRGEVLRDTALSLIAACDLLVLSSKSEGGANVIGEAVASGTPVVSSRIAGSVGLLGDDYPGYYDYGERAQLAALLGRAETDASLRDELRRCCAALAGLFDPDHERASWRSLLDELGV